MPLSFTMTCEANYNSQVRCLCAVCKVWFWESAPPSPCVSVLDASRNPRKGVKIVTLCEQAITFRWSVS